MSPGWPWRLTCLPRGHSRRARRERPGEVAMTATPGPDRRLDEFEARVPPSVRDVLEQALAIISDPNRWTHHEYARTAANKTCGASNPNAVRWSSHAAVLKAS